MRKTSVATKTRRPARSKSALSSVHKKNSHPKPSARGSLTALGKLHKSANSVTSDLETSAELLRTVPLTTEDRLEHIHALGQRVGTYVKFMCTIGRMEGSSLESKDRAVAVFYDRLYALEQELARIHDNVLLG